MPSESEPEKYSIDEMMERLKNRPGEDPLENGELVTRADGSQAIRVRKRKRRSHQPHKEEQRQARRARILQVSGALILVLLAAVGAGVAIVYGNSAPFRRGLIGKITENSGASVELEQYRMNPTHANAGRITLTWPDGNVMRDLTARGIRAGIHPTSFLGKSMVGEEVTATEGTLTLQVPAPGRPACVATASPAETRSIRFKRYTIPRLNVVVAGVPAQRFGLRGAEAAFQLREAGERPQLLINRGEIAIHGWPKLRLDRSYIEFRDRQLDVVGMRLLHESDSRGSFELSGTVAPYDGDLRSTLDVRLESYLLAGLADEEFGRLFSGSDNEDRLAGRVDSVPAQDSNRLSFVAGAVPDAKLVVTFRNSLTSAIELGGFAFLAELARLLDDEWFAHPVFESDATGVFRRENGSVAIEELHLESKGRMFVRGRVEMAADRGLSGKLELGIAEGMIKTAANHRLDALFGPPSNGFRWMTLNLGGSVARPADDFMKLFEATTAREASPAGQEVPTFEELTAPE